ncbi:hypothetical protein [Sutcliffiella halmapala]|uniref:hypothetical protein n=1 Tax=Sutcliffiella halmapala TaxID=79882 RepID=UPI000994F5C1|nr:hypothetical protein [Sutcliffiella halmapala]
MANANNVVALNRLKKKGFEIEQLLNGMIQSQLNKESVARYAGVGSEYLAERMQLVKDEVELLSLQYNFPTKNDVANLAKLMIQIEEKIEAIEGQLASVTQTLEELNKKVNSNLPNQRYLRELTPKGQSAKNGGVVLSKTPGKDSKVVQMERWFYL